MILFPSRLERNRIQDINQSIIDINQSIIGYQSDYYSSCGDF